MKLFFIVLCTVVTIFAWQYLHRPIEYAPGVLISSEPEQTLAFDSPISFGDYQLVPLAHFALDARVLHRKVYRWDERASLVPVDLALGWGPMSDQRVLDQVRITQSMRFYWFAYQL